MREDSLTEIAHISQPPAATVSRTCTGIAHLLAAVDQDRHFSSLYVCRYGPADLHTYRIAMSGPESPGAELHSHRIALES